MTSPLRSLVALALAAGLLAAGCGQRHPAAGSDVVTVGRQDSGETVILLVGQRLVVDLSSPRHKGRWVLVDYPAGILDLRTRTLAGSPFELAAVAEGTGAIVASFAPACGPPIPAAEAIECPMGGANRDGAKASLGPEAVLFKLAVRVEPASS